MRLPHALAPVALCSVLAAADPATPRLAGDWIRLAAPPSLERHHKAGIETVDFCIWQAGDGTWQLVSCLRGTAAPGSGRLLYRWESPSLTNPDWEPKGIFRESDPALGMAEGKLQAPHCIREGDTWWMFCNSKGAHALTSSDGKTFAWAKNQAGSMKFFDMGRDVMLFDHRAVDGKWYAVYTDVKPGQYAQRKNHTVSFRSSATLDGAWGKSVDIGVLTADADLDPRYAFADAESPFIVLRDGWYFRWEQMDVFASRSLTDWKDAKRFELVPGKRHAYLAPEIVEDGGKTWIAAYKGFGKQGIWLAPLSWE